MRKEYYKSLISKSSDYGNNKMQRKAILNTILGKLQPLIGFWIINYSLVWLHSKVSENEVREYKLRGARYLLKVKGKYPLGIGRNVTIRHPMNIEFGENVMLFDSVYLNAGKRIKIGSNSHVDVFTCIYGHGGVEIGEKCAIAAGVRIYSQSNQYDFDQDLPVIEQPIKFAPVKIGNDVWIGANAVILPGVTIGDHSVIGAGAVVTRSIPPKSVAVGVPASVIKQREMN